METQECCLQVISSFFLYRVYYLLHATPKQQIQNSTQLNVTFNLDDEADLAELLISFCHSRFPLSQGKIRQIVWQYAEENQIKGFSHQKHKAGWKWLKGCLHRHKNLCPKKSKNISVNCAMCANPATVNNFFDQYKQVLEDNGIESPLNIWNWDESGVQNIPKEQDVIGVLGEKAHSQVPIERGRDINYSYICQCSRTGTPSTGNT